MLGGKINRPGQLALKGVKITRVGEGYPGTANGGKLSRGQDKLGHQLSCEGDFVLPFKE